MKLKVLAVSLLAFFVLAGGAGAALSVPQPRTPIAGETFYVGPGATGVPLTAYVGNYTEFDSFQASLSATVTASGAFADPLAYEGAFGNTHDPMIDESSIPVLEFAPRGDLYNGSTSGTVYWHPYVSGCETVPSEYPPGSTRVECGIKKYGSMSSFNFTTVKAAPAPPTPAPAPVVTCVRPHLKVQIRVDHRRMVHAKTVIAKKYWRRLLRQSEAEFRRAPC